MTLDNLSDAGFSNVKEQKQQVSDEFFIAPAQPIRQSQPRPVRLKAKVAPAVTTTATALLLLLSLSSSPSTV